MTATDQSLSSPSVGHSRFSTVAEAFAHQVSMRPDAVAFRTVDDRMVLSWQDAADGATQAAGGLRRLGLQRGQTVATLMSNRPEFHLADLAAVLAGGTPFGIYNTSPAGQIAELLSNADCGIVICENSYVPRIRAAAAELHHPVTIVALDPEQRANGCVEAAEANLTWRDLVTADPVDLAETVAVIRPDDIAVLIYTSGTTGSPKGVQLSHAGILAAHYGGAGRIPALDECGRLVSYLPIAHAADRYFAHNMALLTGSSVTCVSTPSKVLEALPGIRPTVFLAVPRIWEKLKDTLETSFLTHQDEDCRAVAIVGLEAGEARACGVDLSLTQEWALRTAERLLFAPARERLGLDQARALVSGAAPVGAEVLQFFSAMGLEILEGYGMSETSAVISLNSPGSARIGTVGRPIEGVEVRLAADGEILVRGDVVMAGYRKDPERTAEAIDEQGWLHTGDVGSLDDEGMLRIVDRKKELIIDARGKNLSPANIELAIKAATPLLSAAVAIGDRRPYVTALLVLDVDACAAYARVQQLPDPTPRGLALDPQVLELVADGIATANQHLSRPEQIKRWTLLEDTWEPGGGELTPTLKFQRRRIAERYAACIEAMYEASPVV
jgi:long-subunit acyl-CoA synthetase (AMP-forming)